MSRISKRALNELVWRRVVEVLAGRNLDLRYLKRAVHRNKNTYTSWGKTPRPMLKLSDIEEFAEALGIGPAELVSQPNGTLPGSDRQLLLPFGGPREHAVDVEVECTAEGILIRRPVGRVAASDRHRGQKQA